MNTFFQFIKPGELKKWPGDYENLFIDRSELREVVFSALNLADSAGGFFRGAYPIQSPSFWWGDSIVLPWNDEYWKKLEDGRHWAPATIGDEVESIARQLTAAARSNGLNEPWDQVTYLTSDFAGSAKLTMQGLAVEAMLAVDGFLLRISRGEFIESMPWLVSANTNIIECTCHAQKILGSASENARAAANIRHAENRSMKADVFLWLDANMVNFRSMDKAAAAITKQQPIVFRTAQAWTSEWKKLRSASTP